jgi:hypothetical protein
VFATMFGVAMLGIVGVIFLKGISPIWRLQPAAGVAYHRGSGVVVEVRSYSWCVHDSGENYCNLVGRKLRYTAFKLLLYARLNGDSVYYLL